MRKPTLVGMALSVWLVASFCTPLTELPNGDWKSILAELQATSVIKPPYAKVSDDGNAQVRVQILTPWAQAAEAAKRARIHGEELTRADAEEILARKKVIVRALILTPLSDPNYPTHFMVKFREGEIVIHPESETHTFNPQGSEVGQYRTEAEAIFDLSALEAADAKAKCFTKDQVSVNWASGRFSVVKFRWRELK